MAKDALYLLDTNILLALIRGKELGKYITHTYKLAEVLRRPLISIVAYGELMAMAERQNWVEKRRNSLNSMLDSMVTLDLNDPAILEGYVAVDQANMKVQKGARVLSNNDMWIAATTRAANAVLLTTDQDFLHLNPRVCAVEYVDPQSSLPETLSGPQQTIQ
ncbi:MAG: type II toxin-antitoxin system VapC family toxin [Acidobacteriaceae bacterium]